MKLSLALILLCVIGCTPDGKAAGLQKPLVIAVIDTGFGFKDRGHDAKLCKYGHKDFTVHYDTDPTPDTTKNYGTVTPVPIDYHGHGTNIVGLIERSLKGRDDYCIVIIKFFTDAQTNHENILASIRAFNYARNIKVGLVNASLGGSGFERLENRIVKRYLNAGGTLVAAAGNENENLDDKKNSYYPAQYDARIIVVGNVDAQGKRVPSSNYGSCVKRVENGFEQEAYGIKMTGTSQATAIATGKVALEILSARK